MEPTDVRAEAVSRPGSAAAGLMALGLLAAVPAVAAAAPQACQTVPTHQAQLDRLAEKAKPGPNDSPSAAQVKSRLATAVAQLGEAADGEQQVRSGNQTIRLQDDGSLEVETREVFDLGYFGSTVITVRESFEVPQTMIAVYPAPEILYRETVNDGLETLDFRNITVHSDGSARVTSLETGRVETVLEPAKE